MFLRTLPIVFLSAGILSVHAQARVTFLTRNHIGFSVAGNITSKSPTGDYGQSYKPGFRAGFSASKNVSKKLFVYAGLDFVRDITKVKTGDNPITTDAPQINFTERNSWIALPLFLNYSIGHGNHFFAGAGVEPRALLSSSAYGGYVSNTAASFDLIDRKSKFNLMAGGRLGYIANIGDHRVFAAVAIQRSLLTMLIPYQPKVVKQPGDPFYSYESIPFYLQEYHLTSATVSFGFQF